MIPILYEYNERQFETQGLGSLSDVLTCKVTEELNSTYELEMTYPVDGIHYSDIANGRIILAEPAPRKEAEPFSIYKITKPINGMVTVYAEHVSYMLNLIPVKPFTANSCTAALQGLIDNSIEDNPFNVWTDKNVSSPFALSIPQAFRTCLGGVEGSILDTYRGEFEFNRFTVKLHVNRGHLKESAKIIYGKNLVDLTQEESISNVVTGIVPYWRGTVDDVDTMVMIPESKIDSEYANKYPYNRTVPYDFSSQFRECPSADELKKAAEAYVKANLDGKPDISLTVSFVSLADSEENKGFTSELLYLGDSVPVYFYKLGIESTGEIVSCTYNVLSEKYESITIGSIKSSLSNTIQDLKKSTEGAIDKAQLDNIIEFQKKLINGGYGGYQITRFINGHPSETVWGDTDDINTMVNCIRINNQGIGISNSGYNGPYVIAGTIAGVFNADFIKAGTLTANLIKAGLLTNKDGSFWVNFDTNEFYFAGMAKTSDLDAIHIGGRNLARFTYADWSKWYSEFSGTTNTCVSVSSHVSTSGLKVGDTVTVRLVYEYLNIVSASGQQASCWIQGSGNVTSWNSGSFHSSGRLNLNGSGEHTFEYSFEVTEDQLKNDYWSVNVRHDYVQSGSIRFKMFKVENGTKATDWSPAPEDLESYADQSSQNALNTLTQQDVFNRLTNGGQTQGLALVDGKLYINAEYLVSKIIKGLTISGSTVQGSKVVFGDPDGAYRIEAEYKEQSSSVGGYTPKGVLFKSFSQDASAMFITDRFFISEYSNNSLQMLSLMKNTYSMMSSFADGGGRADVYASVSSGTPSAILRAVSASNQFNILTVRPDYTQISLKSNTRAWYFMNNDGSLRLKNGNKDYIDIYTDASENCHIKTSSVCYINGYSPVRVNGTYHDIYFQWNGASLIATVDVTQVWSTSDERLKHDIKDISDEYVDAIGSVNIKEFIFTDAIYDQSIKHFGVIAQDVRKALNDRNINPEEIAVNGHFERDDEEYYTIDKEEFVMARIAYDEKRIKELEQKNADLENRLQRLEELMNANNQN